MIRRLSACLVVAVLGGAFIAGCGSSSSSTSSSQTVTTAAPAAAGTTSTSAAAISGSGSNSVEVQQAVAACKAAIHAAPTLTASTKTKLEGVCNKAASGDVAGARKVAREVCVEVVNASPVPSGPAKEQALASCKTE
jgi:hypothetical protein